MPESARLVADRLQAVPVRIQDKGGKVVLTVLRSGAGLAVVPTPECERRAVKGFNLRRRPAGRAGVICLMAN